MHVTTAEADATLRLMFFEAFTSEETHERRPLRLGRKTFDGIADVAWARGAYVLDLVGRLALIPKASAADPVVALEPCSALLRVAFTYSLLDRKQREALTNGVWFSEHARFFLQGVEDVLQHMRYHRRTDRSGALVTGRAAAPSAVLDMETDTVADLGADPASSSLTADGNRSSSRTVHEWALASDSTVAWWPATRRALTALCKAEYVRAIVPDEVEAQGSGTLLTYRVTMAVNESDDDGGETVTQRVCYSDVLMLT